VEAPKDPDKCNLYALSKLFLSADERQALRDRYTRGGLKYSDAKKELIELVWNYFAPHREKWERYLANPGEVLDVLAAGAEKARAAAAPTLSEVRRRVGLAYR
jgi:tryptophanyl-tRNA synthetase